MITYSYRSMPGKTLDDVLHYVVESGISSVELMGEPVEEYAGIPKGKSREAFREWRENVSMDKFKEVKDKFDKEGVKINILKLGDHSWSDAEIDYVFNACKTLGAKGITLEISENAAKKLAPFAEKHNLYVILHNHGQPGDPNFSFEKHLEYGPNLMLNLDVGHYFGATGKDPKLLIEKLHDRIVSIHIKDKTGPNASKPNTNMPFGEGETGVDEILQFIRDKNWDIACDIELEYEIPEGSNAVKEVSKCLDYCRTALMR
ncbi:MAG TPA: sugar phosphate isomerase/epimerase [Thermoclostridium sp.]|nr:sugar phosphate isomerase/epimerase [Thermoclostridium sp.]